MYGYRDEIKGRKKNYIYLRDKMLGLEYFNIVLSLIVMYKLNSFDPPLGSLERSRLSHFVVV